MNFITYIIYCITLAFTTAYAGETGASWTDLLVGMLSLAIIIGIFACITFIICYFRKKKQKNNGTDSKDSEEKESFMLLKSLPVKKKDSKDSEDKKDFIK